MNDAHDEDILITWEDTGKEDIFSIVGEPTEGMIKPKDNLRLDVLVAYKRTSLRALAEYLIELSEISIKNKKIKYIISFISYVLMYAVSPKESSIYFSKNNMFREVDGLFENEYGEKFIRKEKLEGLEEINSVIKVLVRNKLFEEDEDRYYVIGFILKNLEINFKK